jgi:enterochelin esterase-like enzyme
MRHPELIGSVAALSPALAVNHAREVYDPLILASEAKALPGRFLLAAGDSDWARPGTESLAARLTARGLSPKVVVVAGDHSDATWAGLLPAVLEFLASSFAQA